MQDGTYSLKGSCLQDATGRFHNKKDSTYGTPGVGFDSFKKSQISPQNDVIQKSKNKATRMPSRDRPVEEILYNDAIRRQ